MDFLIERLTPRLVDIVKSNVLNTLFSKHELLVHLLENEECGKEYQLHDLLLFTQEYKGFSIDDGRDNYLSLINLNKSNSEILLRLLKKGIVSIKTLRMTHILEGLEFLIEFSEYVIFDDPYNTNFEQMSKSKKYHKYIKEVLINAKSMEGINFFNKFPNQRLFITLEISQQTTFEELKDIIERSKNINNEVKFQIFSPIEISYNKINERELLIRKKIEEYLEKNKNIEYLFITKLTILVSNKEINLNLLNKFIKPSDIDFLRIRGPKDKEDNKIPDVTRFNNVERLDISCINKEFSLNFSRKLEILYLNEIEDFSQINKTIPKTLKEITIRLNKDINKIPIKIPLNVETLIVESDLKKHLNLKSIDLTESNIFNIMLFKNFESMFAFDNEGDLFGQIYGFVKQAEKIKNFDYLPKSVKFFTIDSGIASIEKFEIEPSLLVKFHGVYTNFKIQSDQYFLEPKLYNETILTGRCE